MSVRTDLAAALAAALPDTYVVKARTACPEQIDPGTYAVRVLPSTVAPGPRFRSLTYTHTVWVLTGAADPDTVDDKLDPALDDVLAALLPLGSLAVEQAERGVMDDNDGPRWHGYRLTITCYGTITVED